MSIVASIRACRPRSRPYDVRDGILEVLVAAMPQGSWPGDFRTIRSPLYPRSVREMTGDVRVLPIRGCPIGPYADELLFTSRSRMPIPPPVKSLMRKELLLGGSAGAALCAVIVGLALSVGPMLGIDWNGDSGAQGTQQAVALPAIPASRTPDADVLRARTRAPRVVDRTDQPTTSDRPAAA